MTTQLSLDHEEDKAVPEEEVGKVATLMRAVEDDTAMSYS